jgi:hypothetical protein
VRLIFIKKTKNKKKLDFHTSKKSISRNGYDERKNGIANEFQFFFDPNDGNVSERNSKSTQFFFLENY